MSRFLLSLPFCGSNPTESAIHAFHRISSHLALVRLSRVNPGAERSVLGARLGHVPRVSFRRFELSRLGSRDSAAARFLCTTIGTQNAVFTRDPDLMRRTFQLEGPYPRHPLPESWTYFNQKYNYQRGMLFMDGEEWLQARKLFNKPLLKNVTWMEAPIERVCAEKVEEIKAISARHRSGAFDNIEQFLYRWSVEVVLSLMLGQSFARCQQSAEFRALVSQFSAVVYEIFRCSSELMNVPPALADRMNLAPWQQFEQVVPKTISLASSIIQFGMQHTELKDGLLYELHDQIDEELLRRIFVDFIIAAGDTTSFATVWALYSLASNPDVQEAVRHSIEQSGGLSSVAVNGVVRETLRLYPVAPFVGRFAEADAPFGGYHLPKDTLVLLSLYSAGRDERFFSAPDDFNPYRWQRSSGSEQSVSSAPLATPSASLPFAIGARSCVGRKIALLQMEYLLSMLLTEFRLELDGPNHPPVRPVLKLITVPDHQVNIAFKPLRDRRA
ncbi:cytochrome P450 315a1, mitochondrial isoform X2 [Anopheles aquasalis]|uniref:cytochrome P450 315a1, mitochondrial isoform X2 n=1 Tax=Anopheles aquasalis TaxID=42839 RepID=UPI00215ADA3E|nr:cytochrome P450 315a1, mitochondrial isoform X2 [Anopheles aquasalis]